MRIKKRSIVLIIISIIVTTFILIVALKNRQLMGMIFIPSKEYKPTFLPTDTTELFEYDGYIKSNPVYIYVQGGPNWELFDRKISPFASMPHSGKYVKVFPYQSQIINQTILAANPVLTKEQAQREVMMSAEILYRTISYFKNRKKMVYVLCVSHGSQIGLEMLRTKPNIADRIAITVMRLDIEMEALELAKDGKKPFYINGQELTSRNMLPTFLRIPALKRKAENMLMLFKVSRNRYTELLIEKDLSNVIYAYAKYDEIGHPTKHELDFLKNKRVEIFPFEGGHNDLGKYIEQINNLLMDE